MLPKELSALIQAKLKFVNDTWSCLMYLSHLCAYFWSLSIENFSPGHNCAGVKPCVNAPRKILQSHRTNEELDDCMQMSSLYFETSGVIVNAQSSVIVHPA